MPLIDDRPRSEQLRTQVGPFDKRDLDPDGLLNLDKMMARWRREWQRDLAPRDQGKRTA